jgi:lichenan operon transcriptional antiterminator
MLFNKKEKLIVEFLLRNTDKYFTSKDIADDLGYSDRTIRQYTKNLITSIDEFGAKIIAKQGLGYKITINNHKLLNEILFKENKFKVENPIDRQREILKKLLFEKPYILFDALEDVFFVSHSTLSIDFKKISELIIPYGLSIQSKPNYGVTIKGNEKDIRLFIMDHFLESGFESTIINYIGKSLFNSEIDFEDLTKLVMLECKNVKIKITDYEIQRLSLHVLLSINRVKNGFNIKDTSNKLISTKNIEFEIVKNIIVSLNISDKPNLSDEEIDYISSCIRRKSHKSGEITENRSNENLNKEIKTILNEIEKKLNIEKLVSHELISSMEKHLIPLIDRLEKNIHLENPFRDEITNEYKDIFFITKQQFKLLSLFKEYTVSDDEYSYLTLHILAAIEKNQNRKKLKAIIVCSTGYSSALLIESRINSEFSDNLIITGVNGYYELNDTILSENDLIISSIDLSNLIFKIPCVQTSIFLKEDECKKIKSLINSLLEKQNNKMQSEFIENKKNLDKKSLIQYFFKSESFIFEKKYNKDDVINRLLISMSDGESVKYIRRMNSQLLQREQLSSVAFNSKIAVPHPAKPVGNMPKVGVAIVPNGVFWSSDYPNIQFIFLISPSSYVNSELKHVSRAIVSLTENESIQQELLNCTNFDDFTETFSKLL